MFSQHCGLLLFLSTDVSTSFQAEAGDAGSVDGEKQTKRERQRQKERKGKGWGSRVEWEWVRSGAGLNKGLQVV